MQAEAFGDRTGVPLGLHPLGRITTRDRRYHRTCAPYTADARVPGQSVVIYSAWWAVTLNEQIAALATGATAILAGCWSWSRLLSAAELLGSVIGNLPITASPQRAPLRAYLSGSGPGAHGSSGPS